MPKFFTAADAAKILHCNRTTLSLKIKKGEIPVVRHKPKGRILIPAEFFETLTATAMSDFKESQGGAL